MSGLLSLGLALALTATPAQTGPAGMAMAPVAAPDTTLLVRPGDVLVVENFSGRLYVGAGEEDEVELRGETGSRVRLRLERRGSRISVEPPERRAGDREMDAVLRVPPWMEVRVQGRDLDVELRGLAGPVSVRNVEGDVALMDTRGPVQVSTVDGVVTSRGARGDLSLRSRGDDVRVEDAVTDRVEAQSGDGDVRLRGVDARIVLAETLDGDVVLDGAIRSGGTYRVSTHDGDARILIPDDAGVRVSVSTFDGEFLSDFPVRVERLNAGGTFEFTLGDGNARLEVQVFDGEIRLGQRPGRR